MAPTSGLAATTITIANPTALSDDPQLCEALFVDPGLHDNDVARDGRIYAANNTQAGPQNAAPATANRSGKKASNKSKKPSSKKSPTKKTSKGTSSRQTTGSVSVKPKSGVEGTSITIIYPSALPDYPNPLQALIVDPGVHGYYIAHNAGIYVAYDPHVGSKYVVPARAVKSKKKNTYKAYIPPGVCGIIIKSTQATVSRVPAGVIQGSPTVIGQNVTKYPLKSAGGKTLQVSLKGEKGKPAKFTLTCDKYTFSVKAKADPKKVEVPGPSTVTATLTVKGPAQVIVGAKLTKPKNPVMILAPLAFERVRFDTDFGTLAPNPPTPTILTDTQGEAAVSVSSDDPGTANVRALAMGLGDARATVDFTKKKVEPPEQPVAQEPPGLPPPQPSEVHGGNSTPADVADIGGFGIGSALLTGDYKHLGYSDGPSESSYGLAGEVMTSPFALGGGIPVSVDLQGGYHDTDPAAFTTIAWTMGSTLMWSMPDWRAGPVVGFQSNSTSGFSSRVWNFGGFVEWFQSPELTIFAKAGGFTGNFSAEGFYIGASAKYYATPYAALNAGFDQTDYTGFGGSNETDLTIGGEYLFSESIPISAFAGYTHAEYSGGLSGDQLFLGVRFYLNGDGADTLRDRQRTGEPPQRQFRF